MTQADYLIDLIQHNPAEFARLIKRPPVKDINGEWCYVRLMNKKCNNDCEQCVIEFLAMIREEQHGNNNKT